MIFRNSSALRGLLALSTGLMLLGSCKMRNESNLDSLSMYANEGSTPHCAGTFAKDEDKKRFDALFDSWVAQPNENQALASINAHPDYQSYLRTILSSIPVYVTDPYFRMGGQLHLILSAKVACTAAEAKKGAGGSDNFIFIPFSDEKNEVIGCVISGPRLDNRNVNVQISGVPKILVQPMLNPSETGGKATTTTEEVHDRLSNVVQGFALTMAIFNSKYEYVEMNGQGQLAQTKKANAFKDQLAASFGADVAKTGQVSPYLTELASFDKTFFNAGTSVDQRKQIINTARTQNNAAYDRFADIVFATFAAADFCSADTRKELNDPEGFLSESSQFYVENGQKQLDQLRNFDNPSTQPSNGTTQPQAFGLANGNFVNAVGATLLFPIEVVVALAKAPIQIARYMIQNKPIRTWMMSNRPVPRIIRGVVVQPLVRTGQFVGNVGAGALNVVGVIIVRPLGRIFGG